MSATDDFGLYMRNASGTITINNSGTISSAIYPMYYTGNATLNLTNSGTITLTDGLPYDTLALQANATVTNTGTISGGRYALTFNGTGIDIVNKGTVTGLTYDFMSSTDGNLANLTNGQGGDDCVNWYGYLPTNYKIYIASTSSYGKMCNDESTWYMWGDTNFSIDTDSTLQAGTYTDVFKWTASSDFASGTTGTCSCANGSFNWTLSDANNDTHWDLIITSNDNTAPTLSSSTPADNTTGVAINANIVLNFDEEVDAESGNITIKKTSDNSTVETIDVTGAKVSGSGGTALTINPGKPDSRGEGIRAFLDAYGYTEGQLLGYVYKNSALAGKSLRADEEIQELHGYARRGSVDLEATFNSNNDLVVTGSGSGKIKVEIKWDDNPNTAGTAFDTLTCGGLSFTRSGERGSASGMLDVTGGNTYTVSGTNYGVSRKNGNRTLCLKDNDGSDCNATVNLGGLETTSLSTFTDHKYSTELMAVKETPVRYHRTRLSYKIPLNPVSSVVISYNIIKGSAGYQNSWGVAITNEEGNQIYWARVIEDNTTRDIETTQYTIPYDVLIQYPRKEIVFFLVPDGNGGLSSGQDISFTYQNPGWKNSASTENDWVFFSNSKMNPTESQGSSSRSKVRYNGNNWQWWEDLLDGDDDYDDFKVYYEYMMPGSDYKYDGIECYVFEEPSPTPIMMDVIVREQCEKPLFDGTFVDATITRTGCGSPLPVSDSTYNNATVGKCTGPYVIEINRNQNLKAYRSATLQLKAYGALIQAPESEDIRFQYKLKKNGVVIHEDKLEIRDWPRVGADLGPQFSVADDDVIRFEVDGPFRGPASGNTSVGFILYDVNDGVFEKPWNVNLITSPGAGEAVGRSRTCLLYTSPSPRD